MKLLKPVLLALPCLFAPMVAHAAPICPALTNASSAYYAAITPASGNCNVIITINPNLSQTITIVNANPYDGNDDNYVGVVNNSASAVGSIALVGSTDLFGFDGDGIDAYGIAGNTTDTTQNGADAYGGADAYYTAISANKYNGTINFIGGIAAGGSGYFSLEEAPSATTITPGPVTPTNVTPEPSSFVLLGSGALSLAGLIRRKLQA